MALKTPTTQKFFKDNNIVPIVGDLSQETPDAVKDEVKSLLSSLGNELCQLPFYAFFPADGGTPVVIGDAPLRQATLIKNLEKAIGHDELRTATAITRPHAE